MTIRILVILSIVIFGIVWDASALREPRSTKIDERIKVMVYNPDDVFKFTGFYGFQSSIEFGDNENIETVSLGDTLAWQIVPSGRRMFLKPIEPDAITNMTILTDKRTYFFELHAREALDINDPDMVFVVRFIYPDEGGNGGVRTFAVNKKEGPNIDEEPEKYNFNYAISGDSHSAPLKIFDDGEFTYFQFRDKNAEVPAFFDVDEGGNESLVNYTLQGEYIVLQRVTHQLTLRNGNYITCVFNEAARTANKSWWNPF